MNAISENDGLEDYFENGAIFAENPVLPLRPALWTWNLDLITSIIRFRDWRKSVRFQGNVMDGPLWPLARCVNEEKALLIKVCRAEGNLFPTFLSSSIRDFVIRAVRDGPADLSCNFPFVLQRAPRARPPRYHNLSLIIDFSLWPHWLREMREGFCGL